MSARASSGPPVRLLGRDVLAGAEHAPGCRQRRAPRARARCRSRSAWRGRPSVEQHVVRLDVAVDHAVRVGVAERRGDLRGDRPAPRAERQGPSRRCARAGPRRRRARRRCTAARRVSPRSITVTMPGCASGASVRASRSKRVDRVGDSRRARACSSLTATSRPSYVVVRQPDARHAAAPEQPLDAGSVPRASRRSPGASVASSAACGCARRPARRPGVDARSRRRRCGRRASAATKRSISASMLSRVTRSSVLDQRVGAVVQHRVVALDGVLAVDVGRAPSTRSSGQRRSSSQRSPSASRQSSRVDQIAVALGHNSSAAAAPSPVVVVATASASHRARCVEVDDLDGLAAGQDDLLDVEIAHAQPVYRAAPRQP